MRKFGIYKLRLKRNSAELIRLYEIEAENKQVLVEYFGDMHKELKLFKDYGNFWNNNIDQFLPTGGFFDHILKLKNTLYLFFPNDYLKNEPTLYEVEYDEFLELKIKNISKIERIFSNVFDRKRTKYFNERIDLITNGKKINYRETTDNNFHVSLNELKKNNRNQGNTPEESIGYPDDYLTYLMKRIFSSGIDFSDKENPSE